jgi:hypothetical protein
MKVNLPIFLLATMLLVCGSANAQMVYDSITGANYSYFTADSDEEADKVSLASIEHPITKVRIGLYAASSGTRNLIINIYDVDAQTGLPGKLLTTGSVEISSGASMVDVEVDPVQLTSNEIWVGYRWDPYASLVGPMIGFTPSLGKSEDYIAYKDATGWHLWTFWNAEGNIALQVFMKPK